MKAKKLRTQINVFKNEIIEKEEYFNKLIENDISNCRSIMDKYGKSFSASIKKDREKETGKIKSIKIEMTIFID